MLKSQEHYALMAQFEREHRGRMDKEPKESWPRGIIYQDGHVNELFLTYRRGYAYGKALATATPAQQDGGLSPTNRSESRADTGAEGGGFVQQDAPTDAVMQAGAILSNIAFNMAQRVGEILDSDDVSVLDAARLAWDRAVRTNHAPAQDSDRNAEGLTLHQLYEDACIAANANARDADWLKFMLAEVRRDGMEMLLAALHDEDGFPLSHDRAVAALAAARAQRAGKEGA